MGADLAIVGTDPGKNYLQYFSDEICVRLRLPGFKEGFWILIGRVSLRNDDGDPQNATAKLVVEDPPLGWDTDIDVVGLRLNDERLDVFVPLQGGIPCMPRPGLEETTVFLKCNSYQAAAHHASIVAIRVDNLDFQRPLG